MKYNKILLKISGEAFGGRGQKIDYDKVGLIVREIKDLQKKKVKVAIVCGGGNTIRGVNVQKKDRLRADYAGMRATFKNIEALVFALKKEKIPFKIFTSFCVKIKDYPVFSYKIAKKCWQKNQLVIIGGGTGYPYFSTDMAAVLRSLELGAELLIKATKVDGVFSADPVKNHRAKKFQAISYKKYIEANLKVMDLMAIALAWSNFLPLKVIKWVPGNVVKAAQGKELGTLIS